MRASVGQTTETTMDGRRKIKTALFSCFTLLPPRTCIPPQVRISPGSAFGFVEFERHQDAARAISSMEGFGVGGNQMRLSWGNHKPVCVCDRERERVWGFARVAWWCVWDWLPFVGEERVYGTCRVEYPHPNSTPPNPQYLSVCTLLCPHGRMI